MAEPLNHDTIEDELKELNGWRFEADKLKKEYELKDFSEALAFIVRIGLEAEKAVHHPEIYNVYNNVHIALSTHDAGDKVTQKDVDLAKAIERIS